VKAVYLELRACLCAAPDDVTKPLGLEDFLFIAPHNAQARALQAALPTGAGVGSVDKFQGQEAPACILSLCSSYGEYGSRGYRGRDAHFCAPPAQIPAGVIHAPGSHLGCLTAKRTLGQG